MKIAAYVNLEGEVLSLYEAGCVHVYKECDEKWELEQVIALSLNMEMTFSEQRKVLNRAAKQMKPCKVFLSGEVRGVPYAVLGENGIRVWKSQGHLFEQLRHVAQREIALQKSKPAVPAPQPLGPAKRRDYAFDLTQVLREQPKLVSRDLLLPFLERGKFNSLNIACDHIPHWVEYEAARLAYKVELRQDASKPGAINLLISKALPGDVVVPLSELPQPLPCPRSEYH